MHVISKKFDFCYGHRVHTQSLDPDLSLNGKLSCRHLHGHQGVVTVELYSYQLDDQGMVTDFKNLQWFKKFLDDSFDHKMILDRNDPGLEHILPKNWEKSFEMVYTGTMWCFKPKQNFDNPLHEIMEGFVLVNFVPTSENLCRFLFKIVESEMSKLKGVKVNSVVFNETPKSKAVFYAD